MSLVFLVWADPAAIRMQVAKVIEIFGVAGVVSIQTVLNWRHDTLWIMWSSLGFSRDTLEARVAAGVPVLHPAVLEHLLGAGPDLAVADLAETDLLGLEGETLALFASGTMATLSDISRAASILDRLTLRIVPSNLPSPVRAALFPGRLPEFRAPLLLLLTETGPGPDLAYAVAAVTATLPWWPAEIAPELLAGPDFGPTLTGTLIDLLDRAGQLPDLARALATAKGSGQKAADLAGLIDAFCALARRDDLKTGAETLSMNTSAGMEA